MPLYNNEVVIRDMELRRTLKLINETQAKLINEPIPIVRVLLVVLQIIKTVFVSLTQLNW